MDKQVIKIKGRKKLVKFDGAEFIFGPPPPALGIYGFAFVRPFVRSFVRYF